MVVKELEEAETIKETDKISKSLVQKQFGKQECEWLLWYEKWHSCHVE